MVCCHQMQCCLSPTSAPPTLSSHCPAAALAFLLFLCPPSRSPGLGPSCRPLLSEGFLWFRTWYQCHLPGEALKSSAWVCQLPFSPTLWPLSLFFIALVITCNDPVHWFTYWFSICSNKKVGGGQRFCLSCLLLDLQNLQSHQPFGGLNKYMWMELLNKFS